MVKWNQEDCRHKLATSGNGMLVISRNREGKQAEQEVSVFTACINFICKRQAGSLYATFTGLHLSYILISALILLFNS